MALDLDGRAETPGASFPVAAPSFWFWMKAGIGFTLGAGMVMMTIGFLNMWFLMPMLMRVYMGSVVRSLR
jgi:hypothetical protein